MVLIFSRNDHWVPFIDLWVPFQVHQLLWLSPSPTSFPILFLFLWQPTSICLSYHFLITIIIIIFILLPESFFTPELADSLSQEFKW